MKDWRRGFGRAENQASNCRSLPEREPVLKTVGRIWDAFAGLSARRRQLKPRQ